MQDTSTGSNRTDANLLGALLIGVAGAAGVAALLLATGQGPLAVLIASWISVSVLALAALSARSALGNAGARFARHAPRGRFAGTA